MGDDGDSLTIVAGPEDSNAEFDVADLSCILYGLDVPDHVVSHIESTRALDGQQTDSWDGISARWTYHPERGLTLVLVAERDEPVQSG